MVSAEPSRNRIKIVQTGHITPAGWHGNNEIGKAKAHLGDRRDCICPIGQFLMNQIRTGHPKVNAASGQFARDLSGREQHKLNPINPLNPADIFAIRARFRQLNTPLCEPFKRLFHQPPLGGHAKLYHDALPASARRLYSGRIMPPTAGTARPCPSTRVKAS